jgi:hypothetical protein
MATNQKPYQSEKGEWYRVSKVDREAVNIFIPDEDKDRRLQSLRENKFNVIHLGKDKPNVP